MKILLATTIAGLEENRRLEQEAGALGHDFRLLDLKDFGFVADKKVRLEGVENLEADVVIVRGIFNSIKPISVFLNSLRRQGARIFDNNFAEHKYSIDKVTDLLKLSFAGLPTPKTAYSRDFARWAGQAENLGYPLVLKSVRSGKGAQVFKVSSKEALEEAASQLQAEGKNAKSYLLQEFIPYELDLRCLIIGEAVFAMRRIPATGEFRANYSLGGKVEEYELAEKEEELARRALEAVGMSVGGVDILIDKKGRPFVLEVNHTAGFVGMEEATGENIGKLYLEHALANAK